MIFVWTVVESMYGSIQSYGGLYGMCMDGYIVCVYVCVFEGL